MGCTESGSRPAADSNVYSLDAEAGFNDSQEQLVVKPLRSWKGYLWDTWELPADQRRLLFKLDAFILTFASIGYFLKNIDLNNVNNAFLSGMEEDLEMFGNQLVTSECSLSAGLVVPIYDGLNIASSKPFADSYIHRHFYLDCGICYWTDPVQPPAYSRFSPMGHFLA
jgi:hypothetical protein